MFSNHQTNNVGQQGATAPANGYLNTPADQAAKAASGNGGADAEYNHGPAYAAAVNQNGTADCEIGQRGYQAKLNALDPKGRRLVTDQFTPANQGTTWTGRTRVPKGETFSRQPTSGKFQTPFAGSN
jgi:hypothetical protein